MTRYKVNPLNPDELTPIQESGVIGFSSGGGSGAGVSSISNSGDPQLTGDVTLSAGANVTLTQTGNDISIASSGGGGGAVDSVNGQTGVVVLDQDDIGDGTTYKQYSQTEKTKLAGIETGAEVNNISDVNATDLTDAGDTTLHFHSSDRNRANHTGTQTASTISDFDTEVSNNTDVAANTAARHAAVTLAGEDFLSLTGQQITANPIDLDNLSATGTPSAANFLRGDNTWATPAGSGDVSKVGTPVNNQVGVWTGDGTIEGDANLTFDTTTDTLATVNASVSGTFTSPDIVTTDVQASGSAGVIIKNSGGTQQAEFGSGGGTNATINGTTNVGTASADYHQVAGGTGTITDTATGSSANINVNIVPKGTGRLQASGVNVPTVSSTDVFTNKTLTDSTTLFQDEADNTKKMAFQLSGITTGTTRTLTVPNSSGTLYATGGTDVSVADGGTGRSTSTTAYGLIAAGTTATGALQTLATGATTDILVSGGASALPVWTTATGSGAPVRATSPTLTTPRLTSAGSINDANGNEIILTPATVASAVNEITVSNAATGNNPTISATGGDTNISLNLVSKGTGRVLSNGVQVADLTSAQTFLSKTIDGSLNTLSSIASTSLVEGYVRGRRQNITTNSTITGQTMQIGWGFQAGTAASFMTISVTFPTAFSSQPIVIVSNPGILSGSNPTVIGDLTGISGEIVAATSITTSGFTVVVATRDNTNLSSTVRYGFAWQAIGPV